MGCSGLGARSSRSWPPATGPHLHFSRETLVVARARLGRRRPTGGLVHRLWTQARPMVLCTRAGDPLWLQAVASRKWLSL